jgi:hypothetical protein
MKGLMAVLGIGGAALLSTGCAPDRAQWMAQAPSAQAQVATQDIGNVNQVKQASAQSAPVLRMLAIKAQSAAAAAPNAADPQFVTAFVMGASDLADGLAAIGNSQNDDQFASACLAMCSDYRKKAEGIVGPALTRLATLETKEEYKTYWITFGSRLSSIPSRCAQMEQALQEAGTEEQTAEANHQTNVNRAMIAAGVLFAGAVALESANIAAKAERTPAQTTCSTFNSMTSCTSQ